ncbi:short-chain dehydrogenase protein [Rutstroemia sp. NJR-2017a BVV2]|nr:short-chain dehydrogenase protein [Rutstroemia sp. NJR-2017a BVV2]
MFFASLLTISHHDNSPFMMASLYYALLFVCFYIQGIYSQEIVNGQIYTPGIAIVDAPQPNTPLGGGKSFFIAQNQPRLTVEDYLQVAMDVTSDGQLQLPPYPDKSPSKIYNITMFLSSYTTGKNFTISNGTATAGNASLGEIMAQEPSSTVKHVNWIWPDCLVGDGTSSKNTARGAYNISIRQNFRLNGTDKYTIFDLPIQVTNSIPEQSDRPSCDSLNNELIPWTTLASTADNFTRIAGTAVQTTASSADGIGAGNTIDWRSGAHYIWAGSFTSDPLGSFIKKTALNPAFTLIFLLLARYTKRGNDLSILHETAFSRLRKLFYFGVVRLVSNYLERGVLNNWTDDKYDWDKEIVLITGGAGGIGGQVVKLLAERGIKVVVLDVIPMTFEAPSNVHYYKCDITIPSSIAAVASRIRSEVGDPTILVNNAGVARGKSILESTEKDIRFTFDVNTISHYFMAHEFLPSMISKNHGMVVTVASVAAYVTVPNMVDYASSKAAALSFHEGLTAELLTKYNAPKVRTVVINQGYTKTALFQGYKNDSPFLMPTLEVDTVAEGIAKKILSGKSGQGIFPGFGVVLTFMRAMPGWYQNRVRNQGQNIMKNWNGRQVLDVDKWYAEKQREKDNNAGESAVTANENRSTVLVPPAEE